jgi:hypothetical protein
MLQMTLQGKSTDDFPKGNNKTAYVKALAVLEHLVGHFPSFSIMAVGMNLDQFQLQHFGVEWETAQGGENNWC